MKVITIAVWVLRIAVLAAIILGILFWTGNAVNLIPVHMLRSEERRVGKECRSRWSPYH